MCTTRFVTVWQESSLCPAKRCHGSSCPRMQSLAPGWRGSVNQLSWWCQLPTLSGWWTYPSETYEFASWDDDIPNIYICIYIYMESQKIHVPNHQPVMKGEAMTSPNSQAQSGERSLWTNQSPWGPSFASSARSSGGTMGATGMPSTVFG